PDLDSLNNARIGPSRRPRVPALHLSVEDFTFLMMIRWELTQKGVPAESEWMQAYAILASASKVKWRYATWVTEENNAGIVPQKYWVARKAQSTPWRGSAEARALWQQGLRVRCQPPVVGPDLIGPADLRNPFQGTASNIWNARRTSVLTTL